MDNCPQCGGQTHGDPPVCGNNLSPRVGEAITGEKITAERTRGQPKSKAVPVSNKVARRNAHILLWQGLLVIAISNLFRGALYHPAVPGLVLFIGCGMVAYGGVLLFRLIVRQEEQIAELQQQVESQNE